MSLRTSQSFRNALHTFFSTIKTLFDNNPAFNPQKATNHDVYRINELFQDNTVSTLELLTLLRQKFPGICSILCEKCNILFEGRAPLLKIIIKKGPKGLGGSFIDTEIEDFLFNTILPSWIKNEANKNSSSSSIASTSKYTISVCEYFFDESNSSYANTISLLYKYIV